MNAELAWSSISNGVIFPFSAYLQISYWWESFEYQHLFPLTVFRRHRELEGSYDRICCHVVQILLKTTKIGFSYIYQFSLEYCVALNLLNLIKTHFYLNGCTSKCLEYWGYEKRCENELIWRNVKFAWMRKRMYRQQISKFLCSGYKR